MRTNDGRTREGREKDVRRRPSEDALRTYEKVCGAWEDLCNRCGRCCFERDVDEDGEVLVDYASPCRFFDMETHLCSVYDRRFQENPDCAKVTLETALFDEYLPRECVYRRLFRGADDGGGDGEGDTEG